MLLPFWCVRYFVYVFCSSLLLLFLVLKLKIKKIKLSRELSDIVIYTQSLKFSSFEDAQKNSKFYNIRLVSI